MWFLHVNAYCWRQVWSFPVILPLHLHWKDTFTVPLWPMNHIICHHWVIPLSVWICIIFHFYRLKVYKVKLQAIICHHLQSGELTVWPCLYKNHTWHSYSCRQCQMRQLGLTQDDTHHWLLLKMFHLSEIN